jgi:hypothetical protein
MKGGVVVLLLCLLSATCLLEVMAESPSCSTFIPPTDKLMKVSDVLNCFRKSSELAFVNSTALNIIETIRFYLTFYSFTDAYKASGPPYNLTIDIDAQLAALEDKASRGGFQSDYDFHVALANLIGTLKDGHTGYSMPTGFSSFITVMPLALTSSVDGDTQSLVVSGTQILTASQYKILFGDDISQWEGWTVQSIDGVPAMDWMKTFSNERFPLCKDASINFNAAILGMFAYPLFNARLPGILPDNDKITFQLAKGSNTQTVSINYVVVASKSTSAASIALANSTPKGPFWCGSIRNEQRSEEMIDEDYYHGVQRKHEEAKQLIDAQLPKPTENANHLIRTDQQIRQDVPNYQFIESDNNYLVLKVPHFDWAGNLDTIFVELYQALVSYYLSGKYETLVVDIQQNPGGILCVGQWLGQLLKQDFGQDINFIVRQTPSWNQYLPTSFAGSLPMFDANDVNSPVRTLYSQASITHYFGNVSSQYTGKLAACNCNSSCEVFTTQPFFTQAQIVVITDGVAISTASIFLKELEGSYVRTALVGGISDEPMGTSFSPGGPVFTSSQVASLMLGCAINASFFSYAKLPYFRASSCDFRWAYGAVLEPRRPYLLGEFVMNAPTDRIPYWPLNPKTYNRGGVPNFDYQRVLDNVENINTNKESTVSATTFAIVTGVLSACLAIACILILVLFFLWLRQRTHHGYRPINV